MSFFRAQACLRASRTLVSWEIDPQVIFVPDRDQAREEEILVAHSLHEYVYLQGNLPVKGIHHYAQCTFWANSV